MSTLTPVRPTLRGPVRVLLRQHRKALWGAGALLALGIGIMVGLQIWIATSAKELCPDGDTTPCGGVYRANSARVTTEGFLTDGGVMLLVLAGLIGVFVAGPLIARELESGTFRLAWTQSVSPAQWLAARLAVPATVAVTGITILSLVYRWTWTTSNNKPITSWQLPWYGTGVFPGLGPVAVAYALLAVALGALCAVLVRRTVLSMSATALALGVIMLGLSKRRYELWPTVQFLGKEDIRTGASGWPVEFGMLTTSGEKLYWTDCSGSKAFPDPPTCMRERGAVTDFAEFHPDSHFWPLQLVETGILLALAAIAVALAFRALRRLHS